MPRRSARRLTAIAGLVAVLTVACTAAAPAETAQSPSVPASRPSPAASSVAASPTSAGTGEVLRREAGGLVLSATLDRSRVTAGDEVVIHATLQNPTGQPIMVAGCGKPSARVFVPMPRSPDGRAWTGIAGRFKRYVLDHANGPGIVPALEPLDVTLPGDACADFDLEMRLAPGDAVNSTLTWTAHIVDGVDALPGPVPFRVTAGYDLLNAPPSRDPGATGPAGSWSPIYREIALEGTIEVVGRHQTLVGPGEAIDSLLADSTFADWLAARPDKTWSNANLFLTSQPNAVGILPAGASWDVELFRGHPRDWAIGFVDPVDGSVRSVTYCEIPCDR